MRTIGILVVDTDINIVDKLEESLKKENFKVLRAYNGTDALKIFNENKINLVILDLMVDDVPAKDVFNSMREKIDVPIITIGVKNDPLYRIELFDMGADDYMAKPFCNKEVVARVKAILKRTEKCAEKEVLTFNNDELVIKNNSHEVFKNGNIVTLTATEYKILHILAKNPKRVYSREQLLLLALGEENESYDRVIDTHIKNLRGKIETDSKKPAYIITVYGVGYRFEGM